MQEKSRTSICVPPLLGKPDASGGQHVLPGAAGRRLVSTFGQKNVCAALPPLALFHRANTDSQRSLALITVCGSAKTGA